MIKTLGIPERNLVSWFREARHAMSPVQTIELWAVARRNDGEIYAKLIWLKPEILHFSPRFFFCARRREEVGLLCLRLEALTKVEVEPISPTTAKGWE